MQHDYFKFIKIEGDKREPVVCSVTFTNKINTGDQVTTFFKRPLETGFYAAICKYQIHIAEIHGRTHTDIWTMENGEPVPVKFESLTIEGETLELFRHDREYQEPLAAADKKLIIDICGGDSVRTVSDFLKATYSNQDFTASEWPGIIAAIKQAVNAKPQGGNNQETKKRTGDPEKLQVVDKIMADFEKNPADFVSKNRHGCNIHWAGIVDKYKFPYESGWQRRGESLRGFMQRYCKRFYNDLKTYM